MGASEAAELDVHQAASSYEYAVRSLDRSALLRHDLMAFVREEVDLNRDGRLSRYEVYAGLAKLIKREQWNDALADLLWKLRLPAA